MNEWMKEQMNNNLIDNDDMKKTKTNKHKNKKTQL